MKKFALFIALLFAMALGGCSSDDNVGNDPVDPIIPIDPVDRGGLNDDGTYTLKGIVNGYDVDYYDPNGEGIAVSVISYKPDPADPNSTIEYVLAYGTINPDSSLSILLPVIPPEDLVDNGDVSIGRTESIFINDPDEPSVVCQGDNGNMIFIYAGQDGVVDSVLPVTEGWNVAAITGNGVAEGNGIENTCEWVVMDGR